MNNFDTKRVATYGLLIILTLFVVFHLLIMVGIKPFEIVWGGRLKDASQMLSFEAISVMINLIMLATVSVYAGILQVNINPRVIKVGFWLMFVIFFLNTIGNLASVNNFEQMVFTPVTLLLAIFSLRLAISKEQKLSS